MTLDEILDFFPAQIRSIVDNANFSDVMVNSDGTVWVDKGGPLDSTPVAQVPIAEVLYGIRTVAGKMTGGWLSPASPILDTRLPDGSRMAAVLTNGQLTMTIRRFNRWFTFSELVESGTISQGASGAAWTLGDAVENAANIVVSGGTGSGKSTLTRALLGLVPKNERIIAIEKPTELRLREIFPNCVELEARDAIEDMPAITVADLLQSALRHRPDRIVVGEVREPESAGELLQAMNTGHLGSISTIHADNAQDALYRLADLVSAMRGNVPYESVQHQISRTIEYVVHISRDQKTGLRKVSEIGRVQRGKFDLEIVYRAEVAMAASK